MTTAPATLAENSAMSRSSRLDPGLMIVWGADDSVGDEGIRPARFAAHRPALSMYQTVER